MFELTDYEWWLYGGIGVMAAAGLLFAVQAVVFAVKRAQINRKMDEEYGQPQRYNRKEKE